MKLTHCKKCGAQIRFVRTKAGKWLPCDPHTKSHDALQGHIMVTEDGRITKNHTPLDIGFVPHWATCPYAEEFRRRA